MKYPAVMNKLVIGFDMDGVIADFNQAEYQKCHTYDDIQSYYWEQKLIFNPLSFQTPGAELVIISGRHPDFKSVTQDWLLCHKIHIPFFLIGHGNYQDWSPENRAKRIDNKAKMMSQCGVSVYFEDTPYVAEGLRELTPVSIILVKWHI